MVRDGGAPEPQSALPPDDDPVSALSPFLLKRFDGYLRWYIRRNFHALRLSLRGIPRLLTGRPAVVFTNHPSWWDPALFIVLSRMMYPERPSFGPMDAEALKKYGFFRRVGVFGIEPDTPRGAARFLSVGGRVLADSRAILWVTAEGDFTDARRRPVRLRRGIAHLARRAPGTAFVPLAMEYPFWNERYPEALISFGDPILPESEGPRTVDEWTDFFEARLSHLMDDLAEDAISREATRFETLIDGSVGVGGVYDVWRRLRAVGAGRAFSARHDESA